MDLKLEGKNVLITGGANGLGKQIATGFAGEGANVCICDLQSQEENAFKWQRDIAQRKKIISKFVACDLSKRESAKKAFKQAELSLGPIDILVNNAGIWPASLKVEDLEENQWDRTIDINLRAVFLLCKEMIKSLLARDVKGKIINIASDVAFYGSLSGHSDYAASKGGMVAFSHSIAREYAHKGININAVAPGFMETPMTKEIFDSNKSSICERIPLRRTADPKEIADVVVFLGSDCASYITGSTVNVTGGLLIR